ncbi:hypothetical protein CRM22_001914 [Opisthorchis felineus]|uniref:Uncharacterized protein n=1 Tax=Opisthorchis felineus TaxID=147828 RepID=A0A4S2M8F4_OPIFE|nr:hypothetical protein CRM22_001914 [Opisthorchis felineus]
MTVHVRFTEIRPSVIAFAHPLMYLLSPLVFHTFCTIFGSTVTVSIFSQVYSECHNIMLLCPGRTITHLSGNWRIRLAFPVQKAFADSLFPNSWRSFSRSLFSHILSGPPFCQPPQRSSSSVHSIFAPIEFEQHETV